jgi:endo-1,4-beta-D-glucanase Y
MNFPFPQHVTYNAGTIKPNESQTDLDAAVVTCYESWKSTYLKSGSGCPHGSFFIFYSRPPDTISISEGHGYGMIITALMAGYDKDAKKYFDGMYCFFNNHLSDNSKSKGKSLMAWNQVYGCKNEPNDGGDSATDGDMDIAYALLLADRQWGSNGNINYKEEALKIIDSIKELEINPIYQHPMEGDWVSDGETHYLGTRSSDFIFGHLRAFEIACGDLFWQKVIDVCYTLINAVQDKNTGLIPDFIVDIHVSPKAANGKFLETDMDGKYYYNACRVPWRIGTDYLLNGDGRSYSALCRINSWIKSKTGGDPGKVLDGYELNGSEFGTFATMPFLAPFGVAAMIDSSNQDWLNVIWKMVSSAKSFDYYGDTLKLLCMIVMSGNWWKPN